MAFTGSASTAAAAAHPPERHRPRGALQRRGRLAELLDPRAGRAPGHPGVRPVRQAARAGDDGEGGPEVHRHPPRLRAGATSWTTSPRRRASGWRRVKIGNPSDPDGAHGRARRPGAARGGPPQPEGAADRRQRGLRRPRPGRRHRRRRRARRVHVAGPAARRRPRARRAARGRGVRAGQHPDAVPRRRARHRPRRARPGQPGRLARHGRPRLRAPRSCSASRRGTAGCSSSTPRTPRSPPGTARRCPMLVHGGPGRAGGGEEMGGMRGVLHHMQRTAVQGSPEHAHRDHRPLGPGHARARRRRPPVPQAPGGPEGRRHGRRRAPYGHDRGHRALRGVHRRHLLRPHGRGGGAGQPVLRRPRRARLPVRVASPPACSSRPNPARCWPTTAWRTCGS